MSKEKLPCQVPESCHCIDGEENGCRFTELHIDSKTLEELTKSTIMGNYMTIDDIIARLQALPEAFKKMPLLTEADIHGRNNGPNVLSDIVLEEWCDFDKYTPNAKALENTFAVVAMHFSTCDECGIDTEAVPMKRDGEVVAPAHLFDETHSERVRVVENRKWVNVRG